MTNLPGYAQRTPPTPEMDCNSPMIQKYSVSLFTTRSHLMPSGDATSGSPPTVSLHIGKAPYSPKCLTEYPMVVKAFWQALLYGSRGLQPPLFSICIFTQPCTPLDCMDTPGTALQRRLLGAYHQIGWTPIGALALAPDALIPSTLSLCALILLVPHARLLCLLPEPSQLVSRASYPNLAPVARTL